MHQNGVPYSAFHFFQAIILLLSFSHCDQTWGIFVTFCFLGSSIISLLNKVMTKSVLLMTSISLICYFKQFNLFFSKLLFCSDRSPIFDKKIFTAKSHSKHSNALPRPLYQSSTPSSTFELHFQDHHEDRDAKLIAALDGGHDTGGKERIKVGNNFKPCSFYSAISISTYSRWRTGLFLTFTFNSKL